MTLVKHVPIYHSIYSDNTAEKITSYKIRILATFKPPYSPSNLFSPFFLAAYWYYYKRDEIDIWIDVTLDLIHLKFFLFS